MSGVFGVWNLDGRPLESGPLGRMSALLSHRGSDGEGVWMEGAVGLGHRGFRATPGEREASQPLVGADGAHALVADVRIDNRDELLAALGSSGTRFENASDALLLLAAWERWGRGCVGRLVGDFALVVWDARTRSLTCARDHFGVRPLFYHYTPGRLFAFASAIPALLSLPGVPDEIDELEVARHLRVPIPGDPDATYHRHVRRLPPARILTVSDDGVAERSYWELDTGRRTVLGSDAAYAEAFREIFAEAVRCRLRGQAPVAAMLSGGLDSSAITCMAARIAEARDEPSIHTLSAVYPRCPASDESRYIRDVLERYDLESHFFEADGSSPIADIDRINEVVGEPSRGSNLYLNWTLFGLARESGAGVVLDGFDGDATVSHGKGYLVELALSGRWLRLARVGLPYLRRQSQTPFSDYLGLVRFGVKRRLRATPWMERFVGSVETDETERSTAPPSSSLVDPGFAARLADRTAKAPTPPTTEREIHRSGLASLSLAEALGWIEACGAGQGVEVRFPFFDVRLAEFCLSLPPDQKLRQGWSRSVMRRAMEGILPPSIQWRPGKADLHTGWSLAMRTNASDRIDALLRSPPPLVERYVDMARLRPLNERFFVGATSRAEEVDLWRALSLALWLNSSA